MASLVQFEKKYGIYIEDDSYYHILRDEYLKLYKIYTADGCKWENGMTYKGLLKEIRENKETFLEIKRITEQRKAKNVSCETL